ncbi:MAG: lamin tail domain-containing protein [Parcubacteria group bacterium]|nr:lamin tail domain-containing protein [Parcubacteria group bacterium]
MTKIFAVIFFFFTALVFILPYNVKSAASDVIFTEIMYDLVGADTDHEWVEIYNNGSEPVTIIEGSGNDSWRFNESSSNHILTLIQGSLTFAPGGVAVLAGNSAVFLADHPGFTGALIDTVMSFNNTSDTLKLSADKGTTFFGEVVYQNTWGGNGDGKSLEKINLSGDNESTNWRASVADGGTPGSVTISSTTTAATTTPSGSASQSTTASGGSGSDATVSTPTLKAEAGGDVVVEVGYPISFNGLTSQGATAYKWYLGDGAVKDGVEITHTYQFPGTYLVTLEVSNNTDTNVDQLRVFVFGGKVLINEFFTGNSSTTAASNAVGGWLEIYNPHSTSADISGWILESGEKKFIVPDFVLIPAKGFLVLTQAITGLSLNFQNKITLKYPNGLTVDEAVFEKVETGYSASRAAEGFFWTKEPTPGRPNVVTASGASLLEQVRVVPNKVSLKPENLPTRNYLASFYSEVETLPPPTEVSLADSVGISAQVGFWQKLLSGLLFWVALAAAAGLFISVFYIKFHKSR